MGRQLKTILVFLLFALLSGFLAYAFLSGSLQPQVETANDNLTGQKKILQTEKDFRDKVTELRIHREKVTRGIKQLNLHKAETLEYLKEKGIKSSADVNRDDKDVLYALRNLKGWKAQIEKLESDVGNYDEAISSIEAMLNELERKRIDSEVALSEEDYFELSKIVKDLNERLGVEDTNILEDDELDQLLDAELEEAISN